MDQNFEKKIKFYLILEYDSSKLKIANIVNDTSDDLKVNLSLVKGEHTDELNENYLSPLPTNNSNNNNNNNNLQLKQELDDDVLEENQFNSHNNKLSPRGHGE